MPVTLVEEAEGLFADLLASEEEPVLLHGDLHHHNVLRRGASRGSRSTRRASWARRSTRPRCCITPWRCWGSPGLARSWNGV